MTLTQYTNEYGKSLMARDEQLRSKPNQKLYRITTRYGYTTVILASSKKDARILARLTNITDITAINKEGA